jgi:hypothetical protein
MDGFHTSPQGSSLDTCLVKSICEILAQRIASINGFKVMKVVSVVSFVYNPPKANSPVVRMRLNQRIAGSGRP